MYNSSLFGCGQLARSMYITIWITIWLTIISTGFGANILIVCPLLAKSVYGFHAGIGRSLHAAGHKITIVHPFPNDGASKNFTVIDSSRPDQPGGSNYIRIDKNLLDISTISILLWARDETERDCYNTLALEEIQKIIHSEEKLFDLMIVDLMQPLHECFLPIAEILDIPVIGTSAAKSWWKTDWLTGNPNNPAVMPSELSGSSSKMSFTKRLTNSYYWIICYLFENFFVYPTLEIIYQKNFPNLSVARRMKPSLIFAYSHQILMPRPVVPNVINIGGIHVQSQPAKPLPQFLQKFIDEAEDGVILFTFGSILTMFEENSPEFDIFIKVFAQIPQRVIWKMERKVENLPKNVITSNWLPQRDILAQKNVVAFITHCGLSGIFEAVYEAKPLIMIPIFFDQISNAAMLEDLGVGVSLDVQALSVDKVLAALNNIVQDTKYQKQMQTISTSIKDAPITHEEAVVYWTEYVMRHKGAPHLRTIAADMPLYQYLLLDVILFVSSVFLAFMYSSFWFCKLLWRRVNKVKINHNSKKNK